MHLGTLRTSVLQDHDAEQISVGYFEVEININTAEFKASGMKYELFKHTIARHFAVALEETKVPAEYWELEPSPEVAKAFGLPAVMPFKR